MGRAGRCVKGFGPHVTPHHHGHPMLPLVPNVPPAENAEVTAHLWQCRECDATLSAVLVEPLPPSVSCS